MGKNDFCHFIFLKIVTTLSSLFIITKPAIMKTVQEILDSKNPEFNHISAKAKVIDALSLMKSTNHSYVVVMDDDQFEGILSEKEYAQKVILSGKHSDKLEIKDIMCKDLLTVNHNETVHKCMQLMNTFKTHYLPVFEGHSFKGIITMDDLIKASVNEKEEVDHVGTSDKKGKENFHYWI